MDPVHQYHSPYVAFGNDPINRIDPDGGKDDPPAMPDEFVIGDCKCSYVNSDGDRFTELQSDGDFRMITSLLDETLYGDNLLTRFKMPEYWKDVGLSTFDIGGMPKNPFLVTGDPFWVTPMGTGLGATVKGTQPGLRNPAMVKDLVAAMKNGTFDFKAAKGIISGYKDAKGVYYVSEGHHRMAAAMEIFKTTGDAKPVSQLLANGIWRPVTSAPAAARPLPSTNWWGAFRNWLGY